MLKSMVVMLLDIKILFKTVLKVIKKDDISAVGEATMPKFEGSKK